MKALSVVWSVLAVLLVGFTTSAQAVDVVQQAEQGYTVVNGTWDVAPPWWMNGTLWTAGIGNAVSWNLNVPSSGPYLVELVVHNDTNRGDIAVEIDGEPVGVIDVSSLQPVDTYSQLMWTPCQVFTFLQYAIGSAGIVELTAGVHNLKATVIGPEPYLGMAFIEHIRLAQLPRTVRLDIVQEGEQGATVEAGCWTNTPWYKPDKLWNCDGVGSAVSWNVKVPSSGDYLVRLAVNNDDGNRGDLEVKIDGNLVGTVVVSALPLGETVTASAGVVGLTAGIHNVKVTVTGPAPHAFIEHIRLIAVDDAYDLGFDAGEAAHAGDYLNGFTAGYSAGQTAGYNSGYSAGQTAGYNTGYTAGFAAGEAVHANDYQNGYNAGYAAGQTAGYALGYGAGYTAGYTTGFSDGWDALLEILPPGIRKNVEAVRGFAK